MNIKKIVISLISYAFLVTLIGYASLAAFIGYIYLTADSTSRFCWEHDRYIPDEEFIRAVIPSVKADIARRNPKKGDSSFYANWGGYVPDLNDPNCCKAYRRPTEYSLIHRMFGLQDVIVSIGPNGTGIRFFFDVCQFGSSYKS